MNVTLSLIEKTVQAVKVMEENPQISPIDAAREIAHLAKIEEELGAMRDYLNEVLRGRGIATYFIPEEGVKVSVEPGRENSSFDTDAVVADMNANGLGEHLSTIVKVTTSALKDLPSVVKGKVEAIIATHKTVTRTKEIVSVRKMNKSEIADNK